MDLSFILLVKKIIESPEFIKDNHNVHQAITKTWAEQLRYCIIVKRDQAVDCRVD